MRSPVKPTTAMVGAWMRKPVGARPGSQKSMTLSWVQLTRSSSTKRVLADGARDRLHGHVVRPRRYEMARVELLHRTLATTTGAGGHVDQRGVVGHGGDRRGRIACLELRADVVVPNVGHQPRTGALRHQLP